MSEKNIHKYCVGCGLCKSAGDVEMEKNDSGYLSISSKKLDKKQKDFIKAVCPATTESVDKLSKTDIWGKRIGSVFGWSTDGEIRKKASSGGVITSLCLYLLEQKIVDGIIHTRVSDNSVIENVVCVSTSRDDVMKTLGSRYSPSSPLENILQVAEEGKRYAFVGKPCDATALRNFVDANPDYQKTFVYILSFFCAGLPSKAANKSLLSSLGVTESECTSLTYRGNGWPGEATAVTDKGSSSMKYEKAWGGILGRDVHPFCRFCMDGVGERADLACGDGWYLDENGNPSFEEALGRNIIFVRNEKGKQLLDDAVAAGYCECESGITDDYLKKVQKYQYLRKACMRAKMLAHRVLLNGTPYEKAGTVSSFNSYASSKEKVKYFKGTVKRIIQKKI